jgi:phospho-N-acetylmuramoyl-pentapeptide-transferase
LLYWLLFVKLQHSVAPFRIFRYVTFRTAFASLTALFTALIVGPLVIGRLREFQIGQYIREEGPKAHQKKAGTPTMGGLLIVIAIVVPTLLWADLTNRFVWIAVFSTLAYAAIGFADDYSKVAHRRNLGLTARAKMALQLATGIVIASMLIAMQTYGMYSTKLIVPFFKQYHPDLVVQSWEHFPHLWPLAFLPFMVFVTLLITFSSNAVNLTDGLDGLAIGCTVIAAGALTVLTYVSGHATFAT